MAEQKFQGKFFLVDAYALIFQVFHAIREMSSPKGLPTNALFGFTRDMLFLHEEVKPDYLICVFDGEKPTFRSEIFQEYKANRSAMPEALRLQIGPIGELLEAMRIPLVLVEGYEADDVIATVAYQAANQKGLEVLICTSDKDCRQLISDSVKLLNLRKNKILDREELLRDWGISPEQVVDYQSLTGDSVDNVKGVPGIGGKTATKLLQKYHDIDNLLAHVDELSGKQRVNVQASVETLKRNRQLVRLETNVPMELDWEDWRRKPIDTPKLLELFQEWGFHRFADQIKVAVGGDNHTTLRQQKKVQATAGLGLEVPTEGLYPEEEPVAKPSPATSLFVEGEEIDLPPAEPSRKWQAVYHLVDTEEKLRTFWEKFSTQKRFAIDLETTSLETWQAKIVGAAISWQEGEAWYLAMRGPADCPKLDPEKTLAKLRPILEDPKIEKVNQNIKYDLLVFRQEGIEVRGIVGDSMVADYLLNAAERNHGMDYLARTHLQHDVIPITDLIGKKGPKQKRMDEVPTHLVAEYAGEDADVAWRLCHLLEERLSHQQLKKLYDELEIPLIEVLAELEANGIRLNVPLLQELGKKLEAELTTIESRIYEIAGEEFNIASLKQLRRILFDKLNLKPKFKTKTTGEASTNQAALEELAVDGHELPKLLLKHRSISKLKGTYIDALPQLINPNNGRIHAKFNQTVAATGRLSSSEPNLQNIPVRSEMGGQIRQAFIAEKGWLLLTADYSQVELRLLAHFADDPVLQQAFQDDQDVHSLVASQIYGIEQAQVTPEMRRMAKTVNFGVLYGMSAHGLAQRLQIDRKDAELFIDAYFARYPKVLAYQNRLLDTCREKGYVETILGRRRSFLGDVIRPESTYHQRSTAEREAINMEIQGSAADLIKVAMLNIHRRLKKEHWQTRMLLQIHDELVFEAPPAELKTATQMISQEMTRALADRLKVPLKVEVAAGSNWLDAEPLLL